MKPNGGTVRSYHDELLATRRPASNQVARADLSGRNLTDHADRFSLVTCPALSHGQQEVEPFVAFGNARSTKIAENRSAWPALSQSRLQVRGGK